MEKYFYGPDLNVNLISTPSTYSTHENDHFSLKWRDENT